MKKLLMSIAIVSIASSAAIAGPAVSFPDPRTEQVSYADLDLTSAKDQSMLETRIRGAAGRVCDAAGMPTLSEFGHMHRCLSAAISGGLGQMNQAMAVNRTASATTAAVLTISAKQH